MSKLVSTRSKSDVAKAPWIGFETVMGDDYHVTQWIKEPSLMPVPTLIVGKNDDYNCKLIASFMFDSRSWKIPRFIVGETEFADELLIQKYPVFVVPSKHETLDLDRLDLLLAYAQQVIVLEHSGLGTLVEVSASQERGLQVFALTRDKQRACHICPLRGCGYLMKSAIRDSEHLAHGSKAREEN